MHAPRARTVQPSFAVDAIGRERQPLATIDDFASDPDALRAIAAEARFQPGGRYYPGIRAPLPPEYLEAQLPVIAEAVQRAFGPCRRIHVIGTGFSIVTVPPAALSLEQRLPHVDALGAERIAMIHYLSPGGGDGTAFYRHRSTGFETLDAARKPVYFDVLGREVTAAPPQGYIAGDTPLFERIRHVEARYNRALLYRSQLLHSGAIAPDATLSADPLEGRLTVTGFFAVE